MPTPQGPHPIARRCWIALAVSAVAATACSHGGAYVWVDELPSAAFAPEPYRLQHGDAVSVSVWNQPKLSTNVKIRPDGRATLPLLGDVAVAGLTPSGWAAQITQLLDGLVVDPKVTVSVTTPHTPTVAVMGEVMRVGEYPVNPTDTVLELLARAGGTTEFAHLTHIYVIRRQSTPTRIRFSFDALARGEGRALSFRPRDGDVIVVE